MLMILARLVCSESFWAVVKVRSPHTGPEAGASGYPRWEVRKCEGKPPRAAIERLALSPAVRLTHRCGLRVGV